MPWTNVEDLTKVLEDEERRKMVERYVMNTVHNYGSRYGGNFNRELLGTQLQGRVTYTETG